MPLKKNSQPANPSNTVNLDPLSACLDVNGTYICTAYNPRCFIIQKVNLVFR